MIRVFAKAVWHALNKYFEQSGVLRTVYQGKLITWLANRQTYGHAKYRKFAFFATPNLPIKKLKAGTVLEAKVEQHDAVRAGTHLDFRIKMPDGIIQDFVLVKSDKFPDKTGRIQRIVRTPHHSLRYFDLDKAEFAPGEYGYGTMKTVWRGRIDVHMSNSKKIEFTIPDGQFKGRYAILKSGDGWFITRMKGMDASRYYVERMEFKNTDKARRDAYQAGTHTSEVKENGAHYYLIPGEKGNLVISRRLSVDGIPIERQHNIPWLRDMNLPKKYWGKRIHIEVLAHNRSPETTAGLLNANPTLSRQNQVRLNAPLRAVVFDMEGDGEYLDRREIMRDVVKSSPHIDLRNQGDPTYRLLSVRLMAPRVLSLVLDNRDLGISPEEFTDWVKGKGLEGTVLKAKTGRYYDPNNPHIKDKSVIDGIDLVIVGFTKGTGKHSERLGALMCEDPKSHATLKVGTGFTDYERQWIWDNQESVKGQPVVVDANWQTTKGSWHGPRYMGFHPEASVVVRDEQGLLDFAEAASPEGHALETKHKLINRRRGD